MRLPAAVLVVRELGRTPRPRTAREVTTRGVTVPRSGLQRRVVSLVDTTIPSVLAWPGVAGRGRDVAGTWPGRAERGRRSHCDAVSLAVAREHDRVPRYADSLPLTTRRTLPISHLLLTRDCAGLLDHDADSAPGANDVCYLSARRAHGEPSGPPASNATLPITDRSVLPTGHLLARPQAVSKSLQDIGGGRDAILENLHVACRSELLRARERRLRTRDREDRSRDGLERRRVRALCGSRRGASAHGRGLGAPHDALHPPSAPR